jgi:N4-gp56 family major capsid protein
MSYPTFGVNDAMAVKHWSKILSHSARDTTPIAPLMGEDENSIIQVKTETKKDKGDSVTFALLARLAADGFSEGQTAIGNAEAMSLYSQAAVINEIGTTCAPPSQNSIDHQRIPFNLRDEAKGLLGLWFGERWSKWFFNQVCGNTVETRDKYYGFNAPAAPTDGRRVWGEASTTDDDGLDSNDTFVLQLIDGAVEVATLGSPMVRPVRVSGEDMYVLYLHPYQVTALRTNTSTGQWLDIQKAAMSGGKIGNNPIFTGALGVYNGVVIRKSQDIPLGVTDAGVVKASTRRAVLLGAQAAVMGFGTGKALTKYRWSEELIDHERKLEVGGWTFAGMKKTKFNSADFGTVVISTYAAAYNA